MSHSRSVRTAAVWTIASCLLLGLAAGGCGGNEPSNPGVTGGSPGAGSGGQGGARSGGSGGSSTGSGGSGGTMNTAGQTGSGGNVGTAGQTGSGGSGSGSGGTAGSDAGGNADTKPDGAVDAPAVDAKPDADVALDSRCPMIVCPAVACPTGSAAAPIAIPVAPPLDPPGCPRTCTCTPAPACRPTDCTTGPPPTIGICPTGSARVTVCERNQAGTCQWHSGCEPINTPCASVTTVERCTQRPACRWLTPGCSEPKLAAAGCFDRAAVGCTATSCPAGKSCVMRTINPCASAAESAGLAKPIACAACAQQVAICL